MSVRAKTRKQKTCLEFQTEVIYFRELVGLRKQKGKVRKTRD